MNYFFYKNLKIYQKSEFLVQKALKKGTCEEIIINQLNKLNDTPYYLDNVKINVREGDKYYDSATTWFGTDSCSLNLYDKINGMTQTSPFKYSMNDYIPGVGNRILQGCFELSTDDILQFVVVKQKEF